MPKKKDKENEELLDVRAFVLFDSPVVDVFYFSLKKYLRRTSSFLHILYEAGKAG